MPTRLSDVKDRDWKGFRRVARYYERELKRIKNATSVEASGLRRFATHALSPKKKTERR